MNDLPGYNEYLMLLHCCGVQVILCPCTRYLT
jgi:hypothetical protein